jgi:hypothetical protein
MIRQAISWLAWWCMLTTLWLTLVDDLSGAELVAGMISAAITVTATEALRLQGLVQFAPRLRWLLRGWRLLGRALRDCWLLFVPLGEALVKRQPLRGGFRTIVVAEVFSSGGLKAMVIAALILLTNAVLTHATGRAAYIRRWLMCNYRA